VQPKLSTDEQDEDFRELRQDLLNAWGRKAARACALVGAGPLRALGKKAQVRDRNEGISVDEVAARGKQALPQVHVPVPLPLTTPAATAVFRGMKDIKTWNIDELTIDTPEHFYFEQREVEPLLPSRPVGEEITLTSPSVPEEEPIMVYERATATGEQPWYDLRDKEDTTLLFESRFESGSLAQATKLSDDRYELELQVDQGADKRYAQWFYFSVRNLKPGIKYTFQLSNFAKGESLFDAAGGCRPLFYSSSDAKNNGLGWRRIGQDISYGPNVNKTFTLQFSFELEYAPADDVCYFAPCYPYRYSDLQRHLDALAADSSRASRFRRRTLCRTLAGNKCDLLTITSFDAITTATKDKRRGIMLTARVHPSEPNASWMMKGVIDFLTGPSLDAKILRDNFVFKVVPMLNPDGVIVGNTRCSLASVDLNRMYTDPDRKLHPTIWHVKRLIEQFRDDRKVVLYCDFHGHSRRHNVFMYGCEDKSALKHLTKRDLAELADHEEDGEEADEVNDMDDDDDAGNESDADLEDAEADAEADGDGEPDAEDEGDGDGEGDGDADADADADDDQEPEVEGDAKENADEPGTQQTQSEGKSETQELQDSATMKTKAKLEENEPAKLPLETKASKGNAPSTKDADAGTKKENTTPERQPSTSKSASRVKQRKPKSKKKGNKRRKRKLSAKRLTAKQLQEARELAKQAALRRRLLPKLLSEASFVFSSRDSSYRIQRSKESTGRVCVHRESGGSTLCYTLEASLGGVDSGGRRHHLNHSHLESMGRALGDALLDMVELKEL